MKKLISALLCISLLSGCSAFAPRKQDFTVMTNLDDSKIYANGALVGTGTAKMKVKRNEELLIVVTREGYRMQDEKIDTTLSAVGVVDLAGAVAILLPVLGFLFPGAHKLQKSNIFIELEKAAPETEQNDSTPAQTQI
ncbi:hypothetical protein Dip518_000738 [Parelusimicrobium proximum]|uniref:hypothetical protein n=1 Tax=Parelusimicrobium proximum TaxID=3228953 RepID=UPI003D180820